MSIDQYGRLPILPARTLRRYDAFEPTDTRFRAAARIRQALWREQSGLRIGYHVGPDGKRRKIGSCINSADAVAGANFVTPEIAALVRRELAFREEGALMDEARLAANLLSSMPLVYNTFGALKLDLALASRVFRRLFPTFVKRVTGILFEHSPARGNSAYTADYTAVDLVVQCHTRGGQQAFIAIELKYSETMREPVARLRPRYDELSAASGLYKNPDDLALRISPLQSLWREHLMCAAMLQNRLYSAGRFVLVAPHLNSQVWKAAASYREQLSESAPVPFETIELETVIDTIKAAGADELASRLHDRYCDFSPLDALI